MADLAAKTHTEQDNLPDVAVTGHPYSKMVCTAFAEGCGGNLVHPDQAGSTVASYGILRGCGEALVRAKDYYYIDHGFFQRADNRGNGYYRVMHNCMWPKSVPDDDTTKFDKLNIPLKDLRKTGSHIIVAPPSTAMTRFLGLDGWLSRTLPALDAVTDRPIIVSEKGGRPTASLFRDAWCVITEHSQIGIDALIEGIPTIFLSPERRLGTLADIENPPFNRDFFSRLANCQFTLDEMRTGECWYALTRA